MANHPYGGDLVKPSDLWGGEPVEDLRGIGAPSWVLERAQATQDAYAVRMKLAEQNAAAGIEPF